MQTKDYIKFENYRMISLNGMYEMDVNVLDNLLYNIKNIVETEAPITLNILKQRLRDALNVKKISQKALDIIEEKINQLGIIKTQSLYDMVLWPSSGIFEVKYLRVNYQRQIYDVPKEELKLLVNELRLTGEALYREILKYFGYEVLTEKARKYLEYIEK